MAVTDEQAILATIEAAPADAAPRLVFADWLDDQGHHAEAAAQRRYGRALEITPMESWRRVWREGLAPTLPLPGLVALKAPLDGDDPRLMQGETTSPPPLMSVQYWPCEAADALGFCGWQDPESKASTVGEVEECFARYCFEADQRLKEAAACRWFLNWYDDTPRDEMRRELAAEVELAITLRSGSGGHP
jgi:uncharacterized protein (TIGR02996 family)